MFFLAIGAIILIAILGILLAKHNLKYLAETKEERIAIRRAYKKKKNEALKRRLGL